jgi:hypothetical protein
MGARKKTAKKRQDESGAVEVRAFTVVLEDIHAKISVFGERMQGLDDRMATALQQIEQRFDRVDHRFDLVDLRFAKIDERFEKVDREFALVRAEMKAGFLGAENELALVKTAVLEELRHSVEDLDARKVDRADLAQPAR